MKLVYVITKVQMLADYVFGSIMRDYIHPTNSFDFEQIVTSSI